MREPPSRLVRKGPLDRAHRAAGLASAEVAGRAVPVRFPVAADLSRCAFADLSALPRVGFKGWRVWTTLAAWGITCPTTNNAASEQPDGGLCLRLGDTEALLLASLQGTARHGFTAIDSPTAEGFFPVPRDETHAWLVMLGRAAPVVLAKICAIDCRMTKFPTLGIAQTSIAGLAAVIVRRDIGGIPAFHVLVDATSAAYLWAALLDAAGEHGGRPIGLEVVQALNAQ